MKNIFITLLIVLSLNVLAIETHLGRQYEKRNINNNVSDSTRTLAAALIIPLSLSVIMYYAAQDKEPSYQKTNDIDGYSPTSTEKIRGAYSNLNKQHNLTASNCLQKVIDDPLIVKTKSMISRVINNVLKPTVIQYPIGSIGGAFVAGQLLPVQFLYTGLAVLAINALATQ